MGFEDKYIVATTNEDKAMCLIAKITNARVVTSNRKIVLLTKDYAIEKLKWNHSKAEAQSI